MIRVFIGYDPREHVAFEVLSRSIHRRSSQPVSIAPVMLSQLGSVFNRPRDPLQSTDFSFSRFLVPFLCGYDGYAIFMDCDMLCLDDIAKLWNLREHCYDVQVVKHDHVPRETTKFLGHAQTKYERKNWSSVMLFNNRFCEKLTPEYVNTAPGLDLHRFRWAGEIGSLPEEWNYLVGYSKTPEPKLIHYTLGGPWFAEYRDCEYAQEWFREHSDTSANRGNPSRT